MTITPNIHFTGQCEHAIALYRRAFSAEIRYIQHYAQCPPGQYAPECDDLVWHSELYIGPLRLILSDTPEPVAPAGNTVSIMLSMDRADEAEASYAVLSENATIITPPCQTSYSDFFASLIDPYGVRWELIVEK